jgi:hypothetical protein
MRPAGNHESRRALLLSFTALALAITTPAGAAPKPGLPPRLSAAPRPGGSVLAGHGEARMGLEGAWSAIVPGAPLASGVEVRAMTDTLRLRLDGGAELELAPGAKLGLTGSANLPLASSVEAVGRVDLRHGELTVSAAGAPLIVQGPGKVLALARRGSMQARVLAKRGGLPPGLAVASYSGDTRVSTYGAFRELAGGQGIELRTGHPSLRAHRLGRGPDWIAEEGLTSAGPLAVVSSSLATAALTVRFAPVDNASGYEVEIARDQAFAQLVARSTLAAEATLVRTPALPPGRYFARVRTRGAEGLLGFPGPTRALRVARAVLPPGTVTQGGTFVLPQDRGLTWDDPTGLEVSVGKIGFVHAAAELGLFRSASTLARVRLAGEPGFVQLALLPPPVHAEIELGPKLAVWPKDAIEVRVRLVGLPPSDSDAGEFEPKLRVKINLDPVQVAWRREGELLTATIPARHDAGPWVVRVEATDPSDNPIGRGFLEVIRDAP